MIAYGIYKAGKIIDIYLGKTAAEIVASHDKEYELKEVEVIPKSDVKTGITDSVIPNIGTCILSSRSRLGGANHF